MKRFVRLTALSFFFSLIIISFTSTSAQAVCGIIVQGTPINNCRVGGSNNPIYAACSGDTIGSPCCVGANAAIECQAYPTATRAPTPTGAPTGPVVDPVKPPTDEFFDLVDPLQHGGGKTILDDVASPFAAQLKTPGGIISRALFFAFPLAGLILFVMLVWAGFEILVGAPTKKSIDAGKQRATAALVGFLLLFATYWIFQIIEVVFGVKIL